MDVANVIAGIDQYLERTGKSSVGPVEANAALEQMGILNDRGLRPGLPLRKLLRDGLLPHAYQPGGKDTEWVIPHSKLQLKHTSIDPSFKAG